MVQTCITCGVWKPLSNNEWTFIVDTKKCARSLTLKTTTTLDELKVTVSEDYGVDQGMVDVEISYFPSDLIGNCGFAPIIVTNNRQVENLIGYLRKGSKVRLCVTFKPVLKYQRSRGQIDLNADPIDSSDGVGIDLNDIINIMRTDHGVELSYSQAWESREYAVNIVRGIQEQSFSRIPSYLHMLKEANPGTFTNYEYDGDGRFKYLFLSFGQCVRGFYKAIRRVIVIDGTFLRSKYKGTLLVATAVDGDSSLYPIAFGVVDTENDLSWEWFFLQLRGVIADDKDLAFVSDRHVSIAKSLAKFYPLASHGICIHHLLNNVITYFKAKGLAGLVEKASKSYRVAEFNEIFQRICSINPLIGKYLEDADVRKWARCHFPGYRFDIRTTNPAESVNSALRAPREYPLIPLFDIIRETLTRWFYERRGKSAKHNDPLTRKVEKKVARRIEKAKTLIALPSTTTIFQVKGDKFDCVVDLDRRTCSCRKFDLGKIPCRHAIKAAFSIGKMEIHELADATYSTNAWKTAYEESINPIPVPEDEWRVPRHVKDDQVLPPESRRGAGRRRNRRYQTVVDKIRSSQGSQARKRPKCSRCHKEGHNRSTCDMPI